MPYVPRVDRALLEKEIGALSERLRSFAIDGRFNIGLMNYTITSLILRTLPHGDYASINAIVGLLGCVSNEFYRKVASPYEDYKCRDNGDVY